MHHSLNYLVGFSCVLHGREIKSTCLQEVPKLPRVLFIMAVLFIIIFVQVNYLNFIFSHFFYICCNVSEDAFYAFEIRIFSNSGFLLIAG